MTFDCFRHRRRSTRLPGREYTYGPYLVTVVSHERQPIFGEMVDSGVVPTEYGQIAREEWSRIGELRPYVHLDAFVVMPNHIHGILVIERRDGAGADAGARRASPQQETGEPYVHPTGPAVGSLGAAIGGFKSAVSRRVNALRGTPGWTVWQRGYYERVLRNEAELERYRLYIRDNPASWLRDPENASTRDVD